MQKFRIYNAYKYVSMLNVLSFFFIEWCETYYELEEECFDAQCFELFLYIIKLSTTVIIDTEGFDAQHFELFLYALEYEQTP